MHLSVVPSISISYLPSCSPEETLMIQFASARRYASQSDPGGHGLVWDGDAQPSLGRQPFKDGEGLHGLLTHSTLVRKRVDTRVLDCQAASDRFDNGVTGMLILWS